MFLRFFAPGPVAVGTMVVLGVVLVTLGNWVVRLQRQKAGPGDWVSWKSWQVGMVCLSPFVLMVLKDLVFGVPKGDVPGSGVAPESISTQSPKGAVVGNPLLSGKPLPLGMTAPDFTLPNLETGHLVHLADLLRHKPVVLVFGSFGCAYFCSRLDRVKDLQERFGDRADFLFVYIDNQHAEPEPLRSAIADAGAPLDAPVNRQARIRAGLEHYGLSLPCVIDNKNNQVQQDYNAFPARLVIVDQKQTVAFDSGSVLQSGLNPTGAATWLEEHALTTKSIPKNRPLAQ